MFDSRIDAGQKLAQELIKRQVKADLVLGIPRGGVVVAEKIAQKLHLPLDVVVVKKLGAPHNPELAIGALAPDNVTYIDEALVSSVGGNKKYLNEEVMRQHQALAARQQLLRQDKQELTVENRRVVLTDDGVATGATVRVAIEWLKKHHVGRIILAVPVVSQDIKDKLCALVDECVILETPEKFSAVGQFYQQFEQVSDEEVIELLANSHQLSDKR